MIDPSWQVEEPALEEVSNPGAPATLVTLHFVRTALRRRWRVWGGLGCLGLILGIAWTLLVPAPSVGTATLLLAHDPTTDATQAMETDVSLIGTRTVAGMVVHQLGLKTTADEFQRSVVATPVGTNVLVLQVSGPTSEAAVARTKALTQAYLKFRTAQILSQSDALINGYLSRVASLQKQADHLTQQYDALGKAGNYGQNQAADLLAQRSQVNAEISTFQQTIQDASLKANSVITASHILDPASVVRQSAKKRLALAMASGLMIGTALGMGLVLFTALTSDRLRRRDEVALALSAPVRFSVGHLGRRTGRWRRIGAANPSSRDLEILVHGVASAISPRKRTSRKVAAERLLIANVDNPDVAELLLASLGAYLSFRGLSVFMVDLSERGSLESAVKAALERGGPHSDLDDKTVVFRPEGVPSLAHGPLGAAALASELPKGDPRRAAWDSADVILTMAEANPAVGVDHLRSWADQVVLLVTAGRSTAERLRTIAELIRVADLRLDFAILVGADHTDESLGLPEAHDDDLSAATTTS